MNIDAVTFIESFCNKCFAPTTDCVNYKTFCKHNSKAADLKVHEVIQYADLHKSPTALLDYSTAKSTPRSKRKTVTLRDVLTGAVTFVDENDRIETVEVHGSKYITRVDDQSRRKFIVRV